MFIGHYSLALAAKKAAPRLSLGATFLAVNFLDLVWPILVLAGIERASVDPHATAVTPMNLEYYPYSHGMIAVLGWSALFSGACFAITRRKRDSLLLGSLVFSHWVLDWVTHRPDLPILFAEDAPRYGLGLWNHLWATFFFEVALFVTGIALYLRSRASRSLLGFWSLIALLSVIYLGAIFGPKPAEGTPISALVVPGLALWLLPLWARKVDQPVS